MVDAVPRRHDDNADLLRLVSVRPMCPEARLCWDALVDHNHYLGLQSLFGKTLCYVAVADERWPALLGWQAAVLN